MPNDFMTTLRRAIRGHALTQKQLAAKLGMNYSAFRNFVCGSKGTTVARAEAMAKLVGVRMWNDDRKGTP